MLQMPRFPLTPRLQKWILTNGTWHLAYTLQKGLNLGKQYSVKNYPTSVNPATDGLRNITGRNNLDGTVTIFGVTSTVSSLADQGGDPNEVVSITDTIADVALPAHASFTVVVPPAFGTVYRGVSFSPAKCANNLPASPNGLCVPGNLPPSSETGLDALFANN